MNRRRMLYLIATNDKYPLSKRYEAARKLQSLQESARDRLFYKRKARLRKEDAG